MEERDRRLAQNEVLFREVNERVSDLATGLGDDGGYEYLCECANRDCTFRIGLTAGEYEEVRVDPRQFVVLPGHYTPEIEELAAKHAGHWIVRKSGDAGEYVEQLDPRSR